ncbi:sensor histidine kinase [Pseudonocardia pini]|uniref:sensor histidine kinase n=1 Tax=Pseudonocardia pini TaxID=2758030 RepID=UPI0015F05DE8|nr:histidine kinase [Pseudonocardia pini]
MKPSRPVWTWIAAAAVVAFALVLPQPWVDPGFRPAPGTRPAMLIAGVVILLVAAYVPKGRTRGTVPAVGVLGTTVAVYPTLLTLGGGLGGPVVELLAGGWHIVPLTLVQLVPVMASSRAVGRRRRRWEATILLVALAGVALVAAALAGVAGAETWSMVVWLGSFLLAPVVTWRAVAGSGGETRRRAILAAVAAMFPVGIIAWCTAVGFLAAGIGADEDASVTALLWGFAVGTLLCGLGGAATTAPAGSPILRTHVVVSALHGLLGTVVLIVGSVVALLLPADVVPPGVALLAGGAATAALTWPWLRLHGWLARVVDPAAELRHELALLGHIDDGRHRGSALVVLRRLVDDPDLTLAFKVDAGRWTGADGAVLDPSDTVVSASPDAEVAAAGAAATSPPADVVLAATDGRPTVVALPGTPEAAARLASFGDLTAVLRHAWAEACLVYAAGRADLAAEHERSRIAQDLHDGLQGRLLGLALNLQLSGHAVDDPSTRLLLEETVGALRSAVEEVRALGGGRQPELLARGGLAVALGSLFSAVRPVVGLDVSPSRFAPDVEATAYYVVSEAVTNALKHSAARRVDVRIGADTDALTVTVSDDGRGGADPRLGSGLRGLAERVAAAGGVLVVRDAVPTGTVVEAVVPCGS